MLFERTTFENLDYFYIVVNNKKSSKSEYSLHLLLEIWMKGLAYWPADKNLDYLLFYSQKNLINSEIFIKL